MTKYNRNFDLCYPFSDTGVMFTLIANTALDVLVPGADGQKYRAEITINATVDVWACLNGTAVLPTSGTPVATYNQEKVNSFKFTKYVSGTDNISFISNSAAQVGISYLEIENIR